MYIYKAFSGIEPEFTSRTIQVADVVVQSLSLTIRLMIDRDLSANYEAIAGFIRWQITRWHTRKDIMFFVKLDM